MNTALVVTTISEPNTSLLTLARGSSAHNWTFVIAGDASSPADFHIEGCHYLDIAEQQALESSFARHCPVRTYSRKNVGYLYAMKLGASVIVE